MDIDAWIKAFGEGWIRKDVDAVMALFAEDVEYWETPFKRLGSIEELRGEWRAIAGQHDIELTTDVYAVKDGRSAVVWRLAYKTADDIRRVLAGTYLITLNDAGLCTYFHHTGELKPQ